MTNLPDIDPTLPSVVADMNGKYARQRLTLTIGFHPDKKLIGRAAHLDLKGVKQRWVLARNMPLFGDEGSNSNSRISAPLGDLYISRSALLLNCTGNSVVVKREPSACRCQINGSELAEKITLDKTSLEGGVVIFLAHRVVLVLRQTDCDDVKGDTPKIHSSLRGSSRYISGLKRQIQSAAQSNVDVLIRGETGTGKELVAAAIHANSKRSKVDLVTVNMSAIPVALAPAALFGSAKGAFTGAESAGVGYFEQAHNGTLFLDEVGDTPAEIQAQLLRVLQEREIQPVGGRIRSVDVRVVAATDAAIDEGSDFKAALLHRLGGFEISLQPLRQRQEDIGELLGFFLGDYLGEAGAMDVLPLPDSDRHHVANWANLFHTFVLFDWPGNVRQLANYARQISLASVQGLVFPEVLRDRMLVGNTVTVAANEKMRKSADVTEQEFLDAMAVSLYEPKGAANLLRISRTAVYRRIDESPILRLAGHISQDEILATLDSCGGDLKSAALILQVSSSGLRFRLCAAGNVRDKRR
jgi:DNA-binding NtrC family response regulator